MKVMTSITSSKMDIVHKHSGRKTSTVKHLATLEFNNIWRMGFLHDDVAHYNGFFDDFKQELDSSITISSTLMAKRLKIES